MHHPLSLVSRFLGQEEAEERRSLCIHCPASPATGGAPLRHQQAAPPVPDDCRASRCRKTPLMAVSEFSSPATILAVFRSCSWACLIRIVERNLEEFNEEVRSLIRSSVENPTDGAESVSPRGVFLLITSLFGRRRQCDCPSKFGRRHTGVPSGYRLGFRQAPAFLVTLLFLVDVSVKKETPDGRWAVASVLATCLPLLCLQTLVLFSSKTLQATLRLPDYFLRSSVARESGPGETTMLCAYPLLSTLLKYLPLTGRTKLEYKNK
ncbi:hypothetical protein TorRG33x02_128720 [Trema orientale]|uniref:Uncharacterized protein n=1 Tax=Trema orientale TaxID=63057 RepID=A0A2P5F0K7_TREOI|nr:hypothetical protein TorRG33x02_128720 [Trema orientale]